MSILNNLPHLATAKRRTRTKDALGGTKDTFSTTLWSDRVCWRQPVSDTEAMDWMARGQKVTHKVYFVEDPGVDERCILVIGDDTMTVRSVGNPDASVGLGVVWKVAVELDR